METSVLTSKGQLLIPKKIRNKYGIQSGVKVIFEEASNGVILRAMNEDYFKSFMGILNSDGNLKADMKKVKEEEKQLEERKLNFLAKTNKKTK